MARSVNGIGAKADANIHETLPRNELQKNVVAETSSNGEVDLEAVLTNGTEGWREREDTKERNFDLLKNFGRLDRDRENGPFSGIGEGDAYLDEARKLCVEFGCQETDAIAAYEAGKILGSTIAGARLAGAELSQEFIDRQRSLFASKIMDGSHFLARIDDQPSDGYDEALRGFDDGIEVPRTDLKAILEEHRQDLDYERRRKEDRELTPIQLSARAVREAKERTVKGDAGALFVPLHAASQVQRDDPAEFQRLKAEIDRELGAAVCKEWLRTIDQYLAKERKEGREQKREMKSSSVEEEATGNHISDTIKEQQAEGDEPFDGTPLEYGTHPKFIGIHNGFVAEFCRLMNERHACVSIDGTTRYLEILPGGRIIIRRAEDMQRLYEPVRIKVPGKPTLINGFEAWSRWKGRRTYDALGFYPDGKPPAGHFNTWQGFLVKPKPGSWDLLRAHILNVYCGGDAELERWFLDWVAQLLQEPATKPGSCIVLRSRQEGTGKSLLIYAVLAPILGSAVLSASRGEQLTGRFNAHLRDTLLIAAEEAGYAGDKSARGILKDLVTCETMAYEAKGLPIVSAPNYSRVIFISNEDWVMSAGPTSRRFCVLDCENEHATSKAYFKPLFAELSDGGVEAFLHDMLKREIRSDLRNPPTTKGLLEQREQSLDGFGSWIRTVAQDAQLRVPGESVTTIELDEDETEISLERLRSSVAPYLGPYELKTLDHKLGRLLKAVGAVKFRASNSTKGVRPYFYRLPGIDALRSEVEKHLGIAIELQLDGELQNKKSSRPGTATSSVIDIHTRRAIEVLTGSAA